MSDILKRQLEEYRTALRIKRLNEDLMEVLTSTCMWLLKYCEKNRIQPPDLDTLIAQLDKAEELLKTAEEITEDKS